MRKLGGHDLAINLLQQFSEHIVVEDQRLFLVLGKSLNTIFQFQRPTVRANRPCKFQSQRAAAAQVFRALAIRLLVFGKSSCNICGDARV